MGRSEQEIIIESATSIDAPIGDVWDLMTRARAAKHPFVGVEEVTFRPNDATTIEAGTEIRLKLGLKVGILAVRGVVRVRVENFDEQEHYFTTSIIEAPLDLQGEATIALSPDPESDSRTELLFIGELTVSRIMAKFVSAEKLQRRADAFMPKIGGMIAKQVRRLQRESDEPVD